MERLVFFFVALVLIATLLTLIAICSRQRLVGKVMALALAALLMPTGYLALADLLGKPKPVRLDWFRDTAPDAQVISAQLREGKAIYLWLQTDSADAPLAVVLPWDRQLASQLHSASREAKEGEGRVRMRWVRSAGSQPMRPSFFNEPQPPLPPKMPFDRRGPAMFVTP